jgi:hypothetical protein
MVSYSDTVIIDQIRNAVRLKGKLDAQKVVYDQIESARENLRTWMKEFLCRQIFLKLGGVTNTTLTDTNGVVIGGRALWSNTPDFIPDADEAAGEVVDFVARRIFGDPAAYFAWAIARGMVPTPQAADPASAGTADGVLARLGAGDRAANRGFALVCPPGTAKPFLAAGIGTNGDPPVLSGAEPSMDATCWHTTGVAAGVRELSERSSASASSFPDDLPVVGVGFVVEFADGSRAPVHVAVARTLGAGPQGWRTVGYWRFAGQRDPGIAALSLCY